jgi:outer membrane immunogenic protein
MSKLHIVAGAALLTAVSAIGPALAADMPARVYKAPEPVPLCAWCGVYVGLNAGAAWGRSEVTFSPGGFWNQDPNAPFFAGVGSPTFNRTNFSGGGQIGVNSQWQNFMFGLEVDIEYIGLNQSRTATFGTAETFTFNDSFKNNWVSTQRLRFGWASQVALIYVTGGLALSQQNFSGTYVSTNFNGGGLAPGFLGTVTGTGSVSHLTAGWSAGGGVEFKLAPNWSLRGEYLYIDLGKSRFDTVLGGVGVGSGFTALHENHMWTQIARAAINYQFGWVPPPVYK